MVKWFSLLFCTVGILGSALGEVGEDTTAVTPQYTLEGVLVTASRIVESPLKLPAQTTVIEGTKIRRHGTSEFGNLTHLIPSGNVAGFGYLGGLSTLAMRNTRSEQVLLLLDGRPVNDPQNGVFNLSSVPLCMLHTIEIVRGGASSLWGANAVGGVVNLVTKRFGKGLPYTRIGVGNGSHETSISEIEFGRTIGEKLSLFLSGEFKRSDGFRTNSDYNGKNLGGNLSWLISPSWDLSLGVRRHESELGVPGDTIFFPTPNARQEDYRLDADLKLRSLSPFYGAEIQAFGSEVWNRYRDSDFGSDEVNKSTFYGIQAEQRFLLFGRHRGMAGLYGERVVGELKGEKHETHLFSGFVQLDLSSHPWMNWFIGGRVDSHSEYGRQLSPSIGATLSLEDACAFYLNWNKSFRAPTLNELYYPGYGNSSLSPELSTAIELGMKMRSRAARGGITYFRRWMEDMIQFAVDDGRWAPYNVAEAEVEGAELDIELLPEGLLSSGFNLVVSETVDGFGSEVMYQPRVKGGGYVQAGRTFKDDRLEGTLIVSGEFVGQRISETGQTLEEYSLIHTKLLWRILDLTIFYSLQNLLNTEYEVRQGYPMDGRNHILGLEWELWD